MNRKLLILVSLILNIILLVCNTNKNRMKWYFENAPGLYDDVYMDLTFVEVLKNKD